MSIYQNKDKNGKVIYTSDGRSWYFRDYYTDVYGKKKQYKSPSYSSKKEAQSNERAWLDKIIKDNRNSSQIAFIDVFEEWRAYRKRELKETSFYSFKKRTDFYIKDYFIKYKLHSITVNVLYLWICEIEKKNFSIAHKNVIINDLRHYLTYARNNYNFDSKILSTLQNFRDDKPHENVRESQWNFWTYEEWEKFINVVSDYNYKTMFTFLYYTGLRFGEFDALLWSDLDLVNKSIKISKSLSNKVLDKVFTITKPKTKNSERIVDLDDNLMNMMLEYKNYKIKNTLNFSENDYIFGVNNKYIPKTTFRRYLNYYIQLAKVKHITPHGFRHSHVSLLIHLGCDSRDVAERVGDTVTMIEKTYYHMFPQKKKATIDILNNLKNKETV